MENYDEYPANYEAERAVLCLILYDNKAVETTINILDEDCFFNNNNRILYKTIIHMYEEHINVDALTIATTLEEGGVLETVGGTLYIYGIEIELKCLSLGNLKYYCDILVKFRDRRKLIQICQLGINNAYKMDKLTDTIDAIQSEINGIVLKRKDKYVMLSDVIHSAIESIEKSYRHSEEGIISTGNGDVDKMLGGGLRAGELITIAGRTGEGKTAYALDVTKHAIKNKIPTLYFSLEMSAKDIAKRLICKESMEEIAGIQYRVFKTKEDEASFFKNINNGGARLFDEKLIISAGSAIPIIRIRSEIEQAIREHDIKLVIVDYLQLMGGNNRQDRRLQIVEITRSLKQFALEYNLPIVILSQLSRGIGYKRDTRRPELSDLIESSSIEQDSDIVMFIHNAEESEKERYDLPGNSNNENIRELIVKKNRNGRTGMILMLWRPEFAQFLPLYRG